MNERTGWAARLGAAALVVVVAGCGRSSSGTDDGAGGAARSGAAASPTGEASAEEPAAEVPAVDDLSIAREPFCDRVDHAAFTAALGIMAPMKPVRALKPGQKYEPIRGEKLTSDAWSCSFQSGDERVGTNVAVKDLEMDADRFDAEMYAREQSRRSLTKRDGSPACRDAEPAPSYGERGLRVVCARPEFKSRTSYSSGYAQVTYYGLIGDAMVICYGGSARFKDLAALEPATGDFCAGMLEVLSA